MNAELQRHVHEAIARLDHVLERGADASHAEIQAATLSILAFRDRALKMHREGTASKTYLDKANVLLSLAYGGEFPLSGLHHNRFEQTRDGLRQMLDGA
ncbi:hypothetical protein [Aurantimonas marina]|uniref:hypothetical protein n=1 Tax=Aurantimonas marina TaxID=2780508 RepID=UPI0019D09B08|nr:hypothetical protein [Aurantimonas marina]